MIRDYLVLDLCQMDIDYEIEIYGWGWEAYEEVKPYFKGVLSHGEEISKVYNSAEYAFVPGGYIFQQRLLEAAASGTTPLVYDSRHFEQEEMLNPEDKMVLFKSYQDLHAILNQSPIKKDLKSLIDNFTYENFAQKMINIVRTTLEQDKQG